MIACLVNILTHALQYIQDKETIILKTNRSEKDAFCEFSFSGSQYPEGMKEKLVGHFAGTDIPLDLKFGIELSLAQLIMEAHNGSVEFIEGKNDKVTVRLHFPANHEPTE